MKDREIILPPEITATPEATNFSLVETIDTLSIIKLTLEQAIAAHSTFEEETGMNKREIDDMTALSIKANYTRLHALSYLASEQLSKAHEQVSNLFDNLDRVYMDKRAKEDIPTKKRESLAIADYRDSINQHLDTLAENGHEQPLRYLSIIVSDVVKDLGLDGKGAD